MTFPTHTGEPSEKAQQRATDQAWANEAVAVNQAARAHSADSIADQLVGSSGADTSDDDGK